MHSDKKLPLTRYWQYVGGSAVNNRLFFNLILVLYCAFVQEIPHIANTRTVRRFFPPALPPTNYCDFACKWTGDHRIDLTPDGEVWGYFI